MSNRAYTSLPIRPHVLPAPSVPPAFPPPLIINAIPTLRRSRRLLQIHSAGGEIERTATLKDQNCHHSGEDRFVAGSEEQMKVRED